MCLSLTYRINGGTHFGIAAPASVPLILGGGQFGCIECVAIAEIEPDASRECGFVVLGIEIIEQDRPRHAVTSVWSVDEKHDLFASFVAYLEDPSEAEMVRADIEVARRERRAA